MKHHPYLMEQEPGREWEGQAPGTGQLDRGMDKARDREQGG